MSPAFEVVETDRTLERACAWLGEATAIAVDTEFARERTYTPRLGLIQVSDGTRHALVDPLPIGSLGPLWSVLGRPDILKILHAPREDLEIFFRLSGRLPLPVFDTQTAAAFAGYGYSASYQSLVRDYVGVEIPKLATRTDWLRRPLTAEQLEYAVLDVVHLHPLHEILTRKLREKGREPWLEEELRNFESLSFNEDPREYYRRVRQAWKLTRRQLAVLQGLCAWREEEAFERDCPRNMVVPDEALVDLARIQPAHRGALRGLKGIHPREIERSAGAILGRIAEGIAVPDGELPEPVAPPESDPAVLARVDFLASALRIRALELEIAPELLARKRDLEFLVRSVLEGSADPIAGAFPGWRREAVGEFLVRVLAGRIAFRIQPDPARPPLEAVEVD